MGLKGMRTIITALAGAAAALLGSAAAQQQQNCGVELNYEDADIRAVVDEIAIRTGRTFLLDPAVQGRVTIKSPPNGGICADEAWELFQAMLRANDFIAAPIGDKKFRIVPLQEAARTAGPVGAEGTGMDLVTQIVRLRYVDSREAAANLAQIVGNSGVVSPVRSGNSIILVDSAGNVERLRKVLLELDRDPTIFQTISLNHASASDIARIVTDLAREISEKQSGGRGTFSVAPVEASNSILVRAEPTLMRRIEAVVAELDRYGEAASDLLVVTLDHADAEELAPLLTEVANNAPGGPEGGAARPNRATISFHGPTNSLIINGDADIQRTLQGVIAQLDVRRSQVLVEAIIVAVSDRLVRDLGFQYFLTGNGENGFPVIGTNFNTSPNLLPAAGAALLRGDSLDGVIGGDDADGEQEREDLASDLAEDALRSLIGTQGGIFGGGFEFGDGNVFGGILTAIQRDTESTLLSTPSVLTLDNQTARLQAGQEIPVVTGEQIGQDFENAFRTINREEIGVILEVTPQINDGDVVTLEIFQETSSIEDSVESTADVVTNQRTITTTALVDDGDILVIGGLIEEVFDTTDEKIPFLGDIPGIGNLFKSSSRTTNQQNLMVFIRPTIIRDQNTASLATRKKLDYVRARELLRSGRAESELDRLIDQVTGVADSPDVPDRRGGPAVAEVE